MLLSIAVNLLVISLAVLMHYEFLYQFTRLMPRLRIRHRARILLGMFAALAIHAAEVWLFALTFWALHNSAGPWGHFAGNFSGSLLDCVYLSFTSYTTLGIGDIYPNGPIRFLVGLEGLVGLLLITWTASFLYLEMTRFWDRR